MTSHNITFSRWLRKCISPSHPEANNAADISKIIGCKNWGMVTSRTILRKKGVLDQYESVLERLYIEFQWELTRRYREYQIQLAKDQGVFVEGELKHTKLHSYDPNYLTQKQLAKVLGTSTTRVSSAVAKGRAYFEKWVEENFGEKWSYTECIANYGLDRVRRYYKIKV